MPDVLCLVINKHQSNDLFCVGSCLYLGNILHNFAKKVSIIISLFKKAEKV